MIVHVLGVVLGVGLVFALGQDAFRRFEVVLDAGLLHLLGFTGVGVTAGHDILLNPAHHASFWVNLAPPCSSMPAVLSLVGLATIVSSRVRRANGVSPLRFVRAVVAAAAVMFLGNVVRVDSSILMGLAAGRVVLVLFHNWVGSIFGFASLLAGWVLLIWMLLPGDQGRGAGSSRPGAGSRRIPVGHGALFGEPFASPVPGVGDPSFAGNRGEVASVALETEGR